MYLDVLTLLKPKIKKVNDSLLKTTKNTYKTKQVLKAKPKRKLPNVF